MVYRKPALWGGAALIAAGWASSAGLHNAAAQGRTPTFTRDVAPIVFQHCAACHRDGESAPFSLLTYDDARLHAQQIAAATQARHMPPWLPVRGYGEFANERRLTDEQIETIRRWVDQGMPEGNAADLPPLPRFAGGWQFGEPDLVVKMPQPYVLHAQGMDVIRNFVIPIPISETRYVKAVELRPGNAQFVHHALMAIDETRTSRRRDEQDAEMGFDGMELGGAHMPDGYLIGWTPGMVPFHGMDETAWRLDPRTDVVLQMHMMPSGKAGIVDPLIGFYFAERPVAKAPMYLLRMDADDALDIPAGEQNFIVSERFQLPVNLDVLAIYPHAHYLGKSVEAWVTLPDGATERLIKIDHWNFGWQDGYRYARPISLPKGSTIHMRWGYDNSSDNPRNPNDPPRRVVAGNRSSDEMAQLQLQVRLQRTEDLALLQEADARHALQKNPANVWNYYNLGNALWQQGRLSDAARQYRAGLALDPRHVASRNSLGAVLVRQGQIDEAINQLGIALQLEPDFANVHFNLGDAYRTRGRLDEAIGSYRAALRLEPGFADAHNSLGQVLVERGKPDEAMLHFRDVVRLKPDSADGHNNLGAVLASRGELEEAIRQFRQALEIEPDHAKARHNLDLALAKAESSGRGKRSTVSRQLPSVVEKTWAVLLPVLFL